MTKNYTRVGLLQSVKAIQVLIWRLNQNATPEKNLFTNVSFFLSNIWCFLDLKTTCASFWPGLLQNAFGQFVSARWKRPAAPVISKAPVVQAPPVCNIYSLCQSPPTRLHMYSCTSSPSPRHSCFRGLHTSLTSPGKLLNEGIRNMTYLNKTIYNFIFLSLLPKHLNVFASKAWWKYYTVTLSHKEGRGTLKCFTNALF